MTMNTNKNWRTGHDTLKDRIDDPKQGEGEASLEKGYDSEAMRDSEYSSNGRRESDRW